MAAIDKFKQQIHSQGLLRGHRFKVKMAPPLALLIGQDDEALERYAHTVSLPGRTLGEMDREEFGENRTIGTKHTHSDCTVSFYLSEDMRERRYIERWQDLVFNPVRQKYGYYDNYVGKIMIQVLDARGKKKAEYTLQEAYPTSIGSLEMEYGDGTVKSMSVTFKYRKYLKTD